MLSIGIIFNYLRNNKHYLLLTALIILAKLYRISYNIRTKYILNKREGKALEIKSLCDEAFVKYGFKVTGFDFTEILDVLVKTTERPVDGVIYKPGDEKLEGTGIAASIRDNLFGGIPVQIGYCNGTNVTLNCLEYHRGSEIVISVEGTVLLVAPMQEIQDGKLDTSKVEAFLLPAGEAVLLYETTLHYAPCNAPDQDGFRTIVVLPKGTNTEKPDIPICNEEDKRLLARNKWLLAHPDSSEAKSGAYIGLTGENIIL